MKRLFSILILILLAALLFACGGGGGGGGDTNPPATSMTLPDTGQTGNYTTTFGEDSDYTINPMSYTDKGSGTILDNVTGLTWQKCSMGQSGSNCATGSATLYNWTNAVNVCGNLSLTGTGWRLPTDVELMTIMHYGKQSSPAIDTIYFPATVGGLYWSSTTYGPSTVPGWYDPPVAWTMNFGWGPVMGDYKTSTNAVRCVLAPGPAIPVYVDNGNGTVTDTFTNLMWERQNGATVENWPDAMTYCEGLSWGGHTDWRLPNVKELRSILDSTKTSAPLINDMLLPISFPSKYWTSTAVASNTGYAWYVDFHYGDTYMDHNWLTVPYSVRCVR